MQGPAGFRSSLGIAKGNCAWRLAFFSSAGPSKLDLSLSVTEGRGRVEGSASQFISELFCGARSSPMLKHRTNNNCRQKSQTHIIHMSETVSKSSSALDVHMVPLK